jgi:very-short-patch-repair endonuclease
VISEAERRKPKNVVLQPGGETAVLFREANKKRRHLPIRQLFAQVPSLLMRLKPCLLMSPLSVSQFLNPELCRFDLVIFDEASQICSEDAVGAIYRGQQLVVCGDNKQLPPTAFFEQGMSDEYEDQDAKEAFDIFDSILDECAAIGMSIGWLRWHYRSRHEDLIAFSNHRFYDNRLVTFPAAAQKHPLLGIEFVHVPDGVYDRGGRRDNQREADIVTDLVERHFLTHPNRSLGVAAFSVAQMNAIEDRIEQLRRNRPEMERYFAIDRLEGFFVKNLENVQGDERDVIIFSVGYGRDQQGRLTMYFGPLNHDGGERRLNVAVTRARDKVIVVSSIRATDLDLSATNQPGILALYHYLDYAERGPDALLLKHPGATGEFETPLEREVAGAIRALGYQVVPQVGCSGYRIDIGVVDPTEPGRFILGVECDGATYHSAYTARDRDRLRQEVLEKLGWKIHRVWAPDWVTRRETEIRRLQEAIEQVRASVGNTGEPFPSGDNPTAGQPTPEIKLPSDPDPDPAQQSTRVLLKEAQRTVTPVADTSAGPIIVRAEPHTLQSGEVISPWAIPYRVCEILTRRPREIEFHDPAARKDLASMLKEVIDVEGPVHVEVAARRLADVWGLQRVGDRMMEAIKAAFRMLAKTGAVERRGKFLWPKGDNFTLRVRRANTGEEGTTRNIEFIPDEEIELAMQNIVRDAISITEEDLITQVARVFGFDRTGENIRERIEWNVRQVIQEGTLVRKGDRIALG